MVITPPQWRRQPWKNGRGVTSEVLRVPDVDDFDLRISVAEVTASGPFSTFPGYRRVTMLLDGGPLSLARDGVVTPLVPGRLVELAGEELVTAHVEGAARLLNILGRSVEVGRGEAEADLAFDLATHETRVYAVRTRVAGHVVWVRYTAR